MNVDLILTADYEVWGNGDGCVEKCVIEPSERMMDIAERHGARITFFLDVCEYWAFDTVESEGGFDAQYKPATMIREQLRDAVGRGHDVQLHLHPQWLNYEKLSNHSWKLDFRYWRLPDINNYHDGSWNVQKLLNTGINTLNDLFKPVNENYKVIAFRAGAWCIQPESEVIKAIRKEGLIIDSTVAPGISNTAAPNYYDFSKIEMQSNWQIGDHLHEKGKSGIYEIPIATAKIGFLKRLHGVYSKFSWKDGIFPDGCTRRTGDKNYIEKLSQASKRLMTNQASMLNYSDGTSLAELKTITNKILKKYEANGLYLPLVAISHPKTFGMSNSLHEFLNWTDSMKIRYATYSEVIDRIKEA